MIGRVVGLAAFIGGPILLAALWYTTPHDND